MSTKDLRLNGEIRVREVRLIDGDGQQRGVVPIGEALDLAQTAGLDLVEVSPKAVPPVCKILDYGKFRFEQEKRLKESKKRQKLVKIKEIRMQPKIEKHDLEFKAKHIQEFLAEGNKVKVTVRFRGRELAHTELGRKVLDSLLELIEVDYAVDKEPQMEGRFLSMILNTKVKK
ncbi:MAG: translation initiation factor IF-3 [Spirochaetales bacterium]|nr:translation initiation factor IF-3 [Spirochaetales bacterium]